MTLDDFEYIKEYFELEDKIRKNKILMESIVKIKNGLFSFQDIFVLREYVWAIALFYQDEEIDLNSLLEELQNELSHYKKELKMVKEKCKNSKNIGDIDRLLIELKNKDWEYF
jgi:hypothetical protein